MELVSISKLPDEILMKILKMCYDIPKCFRLCSVSPRWNAIMHKSFVNVGVINVQEYLRMDNSRCIAEQVWHLVKKNGHKVTGVLFDQTIANINQQLVQLKAALRMIVESSVDTLKTVHFSAARECDKYGHPKQISDHIESQIQSIVNLISTEAINLTDLRISHDFTCAGIPIDISPLQHLNSVDLHGCIMTGCTAPLETLRYVENGAKRCASNSYQVLQRLAPALQNLHVYYLADDSYHSDEYKLEPVVLRFPRLRSLYIYADMDAERKSPFLNFDLSDSIFLHSLSVGGNAVRIVNFDQGDLKNIEIINRGYEEFQQVFQYNTFDRLKLNQLESLNIPYDIKLLEDVVHRVSVGCDSLCEVLLGRTAYHPDYDSISNFNTSFDIIIPQIVLNCSNLQKLTLIGFVCPLDGIINTIQIVFDLENESLRLIKVSVVDTCFHKLTTAVINTLSQSKYERKTKLFINCFIDPYSCGQTDSYKCENEWNQYKQNGFSHKNIKFILDNLYD